MPSTELSIDTHGPSLTEFTRHAADFVTCQGDGRADGLLTCFVRHTSCSLLIQENADPDVQRDLLAWLGRFVPDANHPDMRYLVHRAEGPDDMPAHIKAAHLPVSLSIPVIGGRMALGTWQGLYLVEHRTAPHRRKIVLQFLADA